MVVLKRIMDNGYKGYHSLTIPRAPRSIRRKGFHWNKVSKGGNEMCAFDVLTTVAGNLVEENECSSASNAARVGFDHLGVGKDIKKEMLGEDLDEQGTSEGSIFFSGMKRCCKRKPETDSSSCSVKVGSGSMKMADHVERNSLQCGDSYDTNVEKRMSEKLDIDGGGKYGGITVNNKFMARTNLEEDTELRLCQNSNTNGSFLKLGNGVKLGCKDDDEILDSYSQPYTKTKACKSTHKIDPKVNNLLTSKYQTTAPKLRDYENSNTGGKINPINNKRSCYDLDISQYSSPFKRRKLFDRSGGLSNKDHANASGAKFSAGDGISTLGFGRQKSDPRTSQGTIVSIKSFQVPELLIEIPDNVTVGLLKKTVLERVTDILGGGLRVGVLVHGKKIRDDKTLLQTRISHGSIGFMLEPDSPNQTSLPIRAENPPISLSRDSPKTVNRSQINLNEDKTGSDSKALVPVHEVNMEALAVVPVNDRPNKRCDIGQRRIRRPFSVSEVEALVQAVEKLGTGRWRDVKLCAFENEGHRTYVDLKDKWKTLVHTARISPQQRRGEQVPQDLLDRVLAAQDRQAKQHGKKQQKMFIPILSDS